MSTVVGALEIECAKPDCHWKGSPADAPAHPCPTPETAAILAPTTTGEELSSPFAGMIDQSGAPIADAAANRELPFWVVWSDGNDVRLVGTRGTEAFALELVHDVQKGLQRGTLEVQEQADEPEMTADSDPSTEAGLQAWLLAFGQYDEQGVPQDEKTATLDARLSMLASDDVEEPEEAPEPDLDEPQTGEATGQEETAIAVPLGETVALQSGPRPWQTVIAETLQGQTAIKEYRWLIVWHPADETREAELIGRGKVKNEAIVVQEDVQARGELTGEIVVVKTADVLKAADELEVERQRQLVEGDPERTAETPAPEPPLEGDPETEETTEEKIEKARKAAEDAAGGGPTGKGLFDASDYDRDDLRLEKIDGHAVDRIALKFSGEVMLDRSNPDHVALFRRARLFKGLELWISGSVKGVGGVGATSRDGDLDVVVASRAIKIEHVRILAPEELEDAAREIAAQASDAAAAETDQERAKAATEPAETV